MDMFTFNPSGLLAKEKFDINAYESFDPTFASRYLIQASILRAYQEEAGIKKLKVLDVGGSGSIISQFIDVDLTIIDILPNSAKLDNYVEGSALLMPFADNSFDVVISCDVLEHIKKEDREKFIKESSRVSKDFLIIAAPYNLSGVRLAEISANNFYKNLTGKDHIWLLEHLQDELPELNQAVDVFESIGLKTNYFSHTSLDYWQLITRSGFLLALEEKYPMFIKKIKQLNYYYLDKIMSKDFSETGYRTFLLASKKSDITIIKERDLYSPELEIIFSIITDGLLDLI